jgi:ADP-ribose pyrophosphatase YjhB (NUDIX family)
MAHYQRIRVVGIVRHAGKIVLIEQENFAGQRCWSLPGGRLEADDADMFRGVEREVWEETGLQVRAGALRFMSEYVNNQLFALALIFECHLAEGQDPAAIHLDNLQPDDNIHRVRWWSLEELQSPDVAKGHTLRSNIFWEKLAQPDAPVAHLGRQAEAVNAS